MKFRKNRQQPEPITEGERLPKILPAQCLGEACLNWSGTTCSAYEDLLAADGRSGGTDLPPLRDEATYAIYGLVCLGKTEPSLVAQRAELPSPNVNLAKIIALSHAYGDLPLTIQAPDQTMNIKTVASSDS